MYARHLAAVGEFPLEYAQHFCDGALEGCIHLLRIPAHRAVAAKRRLFDI